MVYRFHRQQFVPGDPPAIWAFFANPRNLDRIVPRGLLLAQATRMPERMYPGQIIELRVAIMPGVQRRWVTEITHVREGEFFVDEQRLGPFRLWHHEHEFLAMGEGRGVWMTDRVTYSPGWGPLGSLVHALWLRRRVEDIFEHRAKTITALFADGAPQASPRA